MSEPGPPADVGVGGGVDRAERPRRGRRRRTPAAGESPARRVERASVARRSVAFVVLAGACVGAMVVDHHPRRALGSQFGARPDVPMPAIRPAAALGATWFCPGVPAGSDGLSGSVVLANPTDVAARAVVTVTPGGGGEAAIKTIDVAERSRLELTVSDFVKAPFAAVQVETQSGALAVEQDSVARLDAGAESEVRAVSACANEPSEHWYFADGATTTDANETLLVYNPFPDDATVDLTFADDTSVRRPPRLQGLPVPPRSLVTFAIGDIVQRKEQVSVALNARVGRVVLGRHQVYASKPRRTLVAGLATPSAGRQWTFADVEQTGAEAPGSAATVFAIYNPGGLAADVRVSLLPAAGLVASGAPTEVVPDAAGSTTPTSTVGGAPATSEATSANASSASASSSGGSAGVAALTLSATVEAGGNALVPVAGLGIPDGAYSALVTSSAPVVVERQLRRTGDPRVVTTVQFGSRLIARRWEFATAAPAGWAPTLVVANPTTTDARVTVRALGAAGLVPVNPASGDVPVPAGGMVRVELADAGVGQSALVVESTVEVVVERVIAPPPSRPGSSASVGMPEVGT